MARTASTMLQLGTPLPDFKLPDPEGRFWGPLDFQESPALLVAFICNHCPFVQMLRHEFARFAREYQPKGLAILAINSNDFEQFPEDRPEKMQDEKRRWGYPFPYLIDESQAVAKAFQAACTPDFYLFGPDRLLVYRGQFDDSRPGQDTPVTGHDLRTAVEAILAGKVVPPPAASQSGLQHQVERQPNLRSGR